MGGSRGLQPWVAVGALVLDLVAFTMILPLLPAILREFEEKDSSGLYAFLASSARRFAKAVGAPPTQPDTVLIGGFLGSLFSLCQFVSSPVLGAVSDVVGRRKALIFCMVAISISHLSWYFATSFPLFIFARVIGGLSRANVSLTTTIVADASTNESRPKGMALIGLAFSIGFVIGPCIGAIFTKSDFGVPALICLGLSLTSTAIIYFFLEETLEPKYRAKVFEKGSVSHLIWPPLLFSFEPVSSGRKELKSLGFAYFFFIFAFSGLEFTLTFLTATRFGYTSVEQGKMFAYMGLTMAILQGALTRRLTQEMEVPAAFVGMLLIIPSFFILGTAGDESQLYVGLTTYCIGTAVVGPALTSTAAGFLGSSKEKGIGIGMFRSIGALGRVFGPLVVAAAFWSFGPKATYFAGAISILIPILFLAKAVKN